MSNNLAESIENLHKEIIALKNEQTEFRVSMTKYVTSMSRDVEWMRKKIDHISEKLDKCGFCNDPNKIDSFKKSIEEIKEEQSKVKWLAIGAASVLSIIISSVMWIVQNKNNIIP